MSIPQEDIDHILRMDGNTDNARMMVVTEFAKGKAAVEIAAFLQNTFHGGSGIVTSNGRYAVWYAGDGIHIANGDAARYLSSAKVVSWTEAAERIGQLLEQGEYATNVELTEAPGHERTQLASKLWFLRQDFSETAVEQGFLPSMERFRGNGFPEGTAALSAALADPAGRDALMREYGKFLAAHAENPGLLRFHYHKLEDLQTGLEELSLPRRAFHTEMSALPEIRRFISEDEIAATLSGGSGMEGGKGRIYAYFQQSHTLKEQADFLKNEYGTGGRSHAISGASHSGEDHSGKGIKLQKQGCPEIQLPWNQVAKRIAELIRKDRYLTPEEKEQLAQRQQQDADKASDYEAEFGADGTQAFGGAAPAEAPPASDVPAQLERYLPVVRKAVEQDTPYRNACGNSDRENAAIEGEAAVRRAVLNSADLQLIRLYSDDAGFRSRLCQNVIDATYPKLHELLRPLSQEEIDDALRAWNGNMDSKRAVVRYMEAHARERDTAAWLSREYGGDESRSLHITRVGSSESVELSWTKVQRRLAQLIRKDEFYTDAELDNFEDIDPVAIRERLESGESSRFVEQVMADVERIAGETTELPDLAQEAAEYEAERMAYREQVMAALTPEQRRIVDAMEVGGFPFRPTETNPIYFGDLDDYPTVFSTWDDAYSFINSAGLKDTPGLREQVQAVLHSRQSDPYVVGDTVYLDGNPFTITEVREFSVQLNDPSLRYPIARGENRENFERLLRQDERNSAIVNYLPADLQKADMDLQEVLTAEGGLFTHEEKDTISSWIRSGEGNAKIAGLLCDMAAGRIETMALETGEQADYFSSANGVRVEILDAGGNKKASTAAVWTEIAEIVRAMCQQERGGYSQSEPEISAENPAPELSERYPQYQQTEPETEKQPTATEQPVAFYPGEQNGLPFDVEIRTLHFDEPEQAAPAQEPSPMQETTTEPVAESEPTPDEVIDRNSISVQIGGEWHSFPNQKTAEEALYADYKEQTHRNAQNFRITDDALGEG
ncbi:MAG: hypothetical protein LIO54_02895, partial [Oscillospiraceae bacterium]|nr:hypothetical protein [Oscillospiraceae bacterium]